ncbi:MAG TPA: hypothetical protein ENG51_13270 [Deltaproteobacteria bacterium]|nr:hypothetical protein [Deltaproteobacteria bacterium]
MTYHKKVQICSKTDIGLVREKNEDSLLIVDGSSDGFDTTLSVMILLSDLALFAHVGDSRIYRLRDGKLEQLTHDQTMAQLSVELGYTKQEETTCHPLRNVLLEALVPDNVIENLLMEEQNGLCCDKLVQEAIKKGGKDNVSVILVKIV